MGRFWRCENAEFENPPKSQNLKFFLGNAESAPTLSLRGESQNSPKQFKNKRRHCEILQIARKSQNLACFFRHCEAV
ncbi:hypothetical protein ACWIUD_07105 [Helicobacter sp. 23-1044]